jgi:anaerobic selenocysteine-containing dehydrogenase
MLDVALRIGPRGASALPPRRGLRLRDLREAPHGIDLGPLEPCLPERLFTRDGRLALAPPQLVDDVARLEARLAQDVERPRAGTLELIGRRELRSNNSWMHNSLRLVKGPARCTLRMHPGDAAARGLAQGALVRITSRVGEVVAPVDISDEMMPGVVSLPHGWGHDRQGARLAVAAAHPGVSINELTDDQAIDALSGNASFSGVPVEVRAC